MSKQEHYVSPPTSPFSKTEFHNIKDVYVKEGVVFGLLQSTGQIIVNFDHQTNYGTLQQIAKLTNCTIVRIPGTWTFTPDEVKDE